MSYTWGDGTSSETGQSELLFVRHQLYQLGEKTEVDERRDAINRVSRFLPL